MTSARLEVLVEPFKEDDPGPHVMAVLDVMKRHGFDVDMGPFSTTTTGSIEDIVAIVGDVVAAGFAAGATSIQTRVEKP